MTLISMVINAFYDIILNRIIQIVDGKLGKEKSGLREKIEDA